jgi:3-oxoacyl-[acyl-carrier protein] reductase
MFNLIGKKALITGATGGIGKEIAKVFHKAGATVIITGTREKVLMEISQELGVDRVHYIVANLSNSDELATLYERADILVGGLDILVCNAAITRDNISLRMKDEEWDEVIRVNLTSTFKLNRDAIKKMAKKRFGRIINITSIVGYTGNFGQANYTASKAGVVGMTKSLALEIASRGITVNCVAPGFIETPMTDVLKEEIKQQVLQKIPIGRIGVPADIASAVLFLASDEASYVTGTTLHVNGGMYMS